MDLNGEVDQYLGAEEGAGDELGGGKELLSLRRPDPSDLTCSITVKYSNYLVAKSLVGIVDDWYDGVQRIELYKPRTWLNKFLMWRPYSDFSVATGFLKSFPLLISFLAMLGLVRLQVFGDQANTPVFHYAFIGVLVYIAASVFISSIVQKLADTRGIMSVPVLSLSGADDRRIADYEKNKEERKDAENFYSNVLVAGLAISLMAGVIINYL